jgi:hypothetical protein
MPDRPNLKQLGHLMRTILSPIPYGFPVTVSTMTSRGMRNRRETFRPWLGEIPVGADEMYLVACEFAMADGSRHQGFATAAIEPDDMGLTQPQIFSPFGKRHAFWLGVFPRQEEINGFYSNFAKGPSSVFPWPSAPFRNTTAFYSGTIQGFMASSGAEVRLIT